MKVPKGFKRWTRFAVRSGAPACLSNGIYQRVGAKAICLSCPSRHPGLVPDGCFDVPVSERADPGSEKAGLKKWAGQPTCCHLGDRAIIGDEFPELQKEFSNQA